MEKTLKMKSKENDVQTEIETSFQQIAKALPREGRRTLLPDIKAGVNSYLAENPEATVDDVIAYVVTPEDIAAEYYANQDGTKITKKIKASRLILTVVLSIVLFVMAVYICFMLYTFIKDVLYYPLYSAEELEMGKPFVVTETDLL